MMAKSEAKESIGVCVCGWRDAMNPSEPFQAVLLYLIGPEDVWEDCGSGCQ